MRGGEGGRAAKGGRVDERDGKDVYDKGEGAGKEGNKCYDKNIYDIKKALVRSGKG